VCSGDELILIALAESRNINIHVYSSRGSSCDRVFQPSAGNAAGSIEVGHIFEYHYQSVV
jgi:hypothetical protein